MDDNYLNLKRFTLALILGFLFTSCGNVVKNYDQFLTNKFKRNGFVSETANINNHNIFYYDNKQEEAPVLLFVHGFGGDGKLSWKEQAFAFNDEYRVIILDILWFGKSLSSSEPQLDTQIEAVGQLINHLALENVNIVGISYGGFISLGVAQKFEDKLASLTIVDSPGVHYSPAEQEAFCNKIGVGHIEEAFVPENSEEVKRMLNFTSKKSVTFTKGIRQQILGFYLSKYPEKQKEMLKNLPNNRARFKELNITVPSLILWGEDDEVFDVENAKALQKQLNAKLVVIKDAGHSLPIEKPKQFNKALNDFIQKVANFN